MNFWCLKIPHYATYEILKILCSVITLCILHTFYVVMFISYSTFYRYSGKLLDPWNVCIHVCYNNNILTTLANIHEARSDSCLKPVTFRHTFVPLCIRNVTAVILLWLMFCIFHFVFPFSDCISYWLCIDSDETELLWEKNYPSATLFTINLIWTRQG